MTITDPHTPTETATRPRVTRPSLTRLGSRPAPTVNTGGHRVSLRDGRAGGVYRRRGRWAITWRGVQASPGAEAELALSEYLDELRRLRLRPLFTGVIDPRPLRRRGLDTHCYAHEAVLDLARPGLGAAVPPGVGSHVDATSRAGWRVTRYRPEHFDAVAQFTPSGPLRDLALIHDPGGDTGGRVEAWVAMDPAGRPRGVAMWLPHAGGSARTLHRVAVDPQACERAVPLLITHAAVAYRACGVTALHLGWRPRRPWWSAPDARDTATGRGLDAGTAAWFAPAWHSRWLALGSVWQLPAAALALR